MGADGTSATGDVAAPYSSGEYSTLEVVELFGVGRSTVYHAIQRQRSAAKADLVDASTRR